MKLFTVGPVEMSPDILEISRLPLPYFRTPEFSKLILECEASMLRIANALDGSRSLFLTASGTGAMEASVMNCLTPSDHALVVDGGSFGHRFTEICKRHHIPQTILSLPFGDTLSREHLDSIYSPEMTALLVNIHETSIGQLYDLDMLHSFCQDHNLRLIVDAISSFLADDIDMTAQGIDVLILSSQKAFALAPGISVVVLSPSMVETVKKNTSVCMYFDFKDYLSNGERGQTPYTPAVGILLTMHHRLRSIEKLGLENVRNEIAAQAKDFREKISVIPVEIPSYPHSNALTPIYFPNGDAKKAYDALYEMGYNVTPSGGALANYLLRVGHIGHLCTEDNINLINAMKTILHCTKELS